MDKTFGKGNSMSNTEIVNETADIDDIELHEVYVYIADDNMSNSGLANVMKDIHMMKS